MPNAVCCESLQRYGDGRLGGPVVRGQHRQGSQRLYTQARKLAASLAPEAAVLEIAPGPGYFAIELARAGNFRITGLDISATFVDLARKNAADARGEVDFRRGDAAHMPFDDNTFDAIFCRAAFKNFSQPVIAL